MTTLRTRSGKVREYLYEREYDLRLAVPQLIELEELVDRGSHKIMLQIMSDDYRVKHVVEVIRLGLIGSGEMTPKQAAKYVNTYIIAPVDQNGRTYIADYVEAAGNCLFASLMGPEGDEVPSGKAEAEAMEMMTPPTPTASPTGEASTVQQEPSASA